jgi:hypothetical protein
LFYIKQLLDFQFLLCDVHFLVLEQWIDVVDFAESIPNFKTLVVERVQIGVTKHRQGQKHERNKEETQSHLHFPQGLHGRLDVSFAYLACLP